MLTPVYKNKFDKDLKLLKKRGKDLTRLKLVIGELVLGKLLNKNT